jgi:carbamoyl-phosphate synthase small subunit
VLEDGRVFRGESYGAIGQTVGEAVFSTAMTGYQETLSDPSYRRQVVVMTAPHIGNTGVNDEDGESSRIWCRGYVVATCAAADQLAVHRSLDEELRQECRHQRVDTRRAHRHLRERGAMRWASPPRPRPRAAERVPAARDDGAPRRRGQPPRP